jgi:hypothetical protein
MISSAHKTLVHDPDETSRVITLYVRPLEGQIIAHGWEIKGISSGERDGSGGPIEYEIWVARRQTRALRDPRLILTHRPVRGQGRGSQHQGAVTGLGPVAARFRGTALRGAP